MGNPDSLIEQLAAAEHASWAHWMEYLFSQCEHGKAGALIPWPLVERWQAQLARPYEDLSETEKESDRAEVRKILPLIEAAYERRLELLDGFVYWAGGDEPCHFDHHGTCQEHGSQPPCIVAEALALLATDPTDEGQPSTARPLPRITREDGTVLTESDIRELAASLEHPSS